MIRTTRCMTSLLCQQARIERSNNPSRCVMASSDDQQPAPSTWQSLPTSVLGRCLLAASGKEDRRAAFSTCTSFTKAMLSTASETQLTVHADSFQPALASVLGWAAECEARLRIIIKRKAADLVAASLQPLLCSIKQSCVCLPNVLKLDCQGLLLLDAHPPAGFSDVFPNLEQLSLQDCLVDTSNQLQMLPLAGYSKLQRLELDPRRFRPPVPSPSVQQDWLTQLQHLASLPSLTALTLKAPPYPTSFLPLWAGQLTELQLQYSHGSGVQHLPAWQSAVSHAAQCTSLCVLKLIDCSAQDLCILVPSLPQLQALTVTAALLSSTAVGSDTLISTLISAPHLTSLSVQRLPEPAQSLADIPCSWRQLQFTRASPQLLSRLPLHSLTQPLQLGQLDIVNSTTVVEVRAAVDNLARSQATPRVTTILTTSCITFNMGDGIDAADGDQAASPAELLRAAGPLVPQNVTYVAILDCRVDAAVVTALQQVAPPTLTSLHLGSDSDGTRCSVEQSFWPQLARSFPQLTEVAVGHDLGMVSPVAVLTYFLAAALLRGGPTAVQGVPKVAHIDLYAKVEERERWEQLNEQLVALGFEDPIQIS